jgi:hypothetical protein
VSSATRRWSPSSSPSPPDRIGQRALGSFWIS